MGPLYVGKRHCLQTRVFRNSTICEAQERSLLMIIETIGTMWRCYYLMIMPL
jgi:hypothetical protein